jgi:hypothetical protein
MALTPGAYRPAAAAAIGTDAPFVRSTVGRGATMILGILALGAWSRRRTKQAQ